MHECRLSAPAVASTDASHTFAEVDAMLLREFDRASFNNRRAEMARLSARAVDKCLAEFRQRGFAGFIVREVDGELQVDGITASEMLEVPAHLRAKVGP